MQKIIVGLGNPGSEYEHTRHNAGFMALDALAEQLGCAFRTEPKHNAQIAYCDTFTLIKPQTYMNESGAAVRSWLQYYKLLDDKRDLVFLAVVYDDLDVPFGSWKWQFGKSPKAHNGVNSIISQVGTDQFWHARIGIEHREQRGLIPSDKYVLSTFSGEELPPLSSVLKEVTNQLNAPW